MGWEWVADGAKWLGVGGAVILAGALAVYREGAKDKPSWVMGVYHRELVGRLEKELEKVERQRDEAVQLNRQLLGVTEAGIRRLPVVSPGAGA